MLRLLILNKLNKKCITLVSLYYDARSTQHTADVGDVERTIKYMAGRNEVTGQERNWHNEKFLVLYRARWHYFRCVQIVS
jgi:hypothetical protein